MNKKSCTLFLKSKLILPYSFLFLSIKVHWIKTIVNHRKDNKIKILIEKTQQCFISLNNRKITQNLNECHIYHTFPKIKKCYHEKQKQTTGEQKWFLNGKEIIKKPDKFLPNAECGSEKNIRQPIIIFYFLPPPSILVTFCFFGLVCFYGIFLQNSFFFLISSSLYTLFQ